MSPVLAPTSEHALPALAHARCADNQWLIWPIAEAVLTSLAQPPLLLMLDGSAAVMLSVVYHGRALRPHGWWVQGKKDVDK